MPRPDPPRRPVLRDLLEEIEVRVEEERKPRREVVDVEPTLDRPLHIGEPVGERERELLHGGRTGLANVVAGDRDRMPERHLARAELDHVGDEPHRRLRREDVLLLRDVLLEDVRLDRPAERLARDTLLLADAEIERQQDRRRRVDRHRRRDLAERDAREERLHVGQRVDRDALAADLAERPRVIRVVAHQRRHVERRRQAGLTVLEQIAEPLVRLRRRPEPGELPHRPEPAAVHRRVHAARVRELARIAEIALVVDGRALRRVERLVRDPRDRREQAVAGRRHRESVRLGALMRRREALGERRGRHAGARRPNPQRAGEPGPE